MEEKRLSRTLLLSGYWISIKDFESFVTDGTKGAWVMTSVK